MTKLKRTCNTHWSQGFLNISVVKFIVIPVINLLYSIFSHLFMWKSTFFLALWNTFWRQVLSLILAKSYLFTLNWISTKEMNLLLIYWFKMKPHFIKCSAISQPSFTTHICFLYPWGFCKFLFNCNLPFGHMQQFLCIFSRVEISVLA